MILHSWFDYLLFYSKFFWFTGVLFVCTNIWGLLRYGSPESTDQANKKTYESSGWNSEKKLLVTYVSRGDNVDALRRSILFSKKVLDRLKVNYEIEAVTDLPVSGHINVPGVKFHQVPKEYRTKENAMYKARALHYALEERTHTLGRWVLHLDEESSLTETSVTGIHTFINDPQNENSIGQGEIIYNSYNYGKHFFNTVIDSVRPGDDLGRFRFQYKTVHRPLFGMHGSFILVPERIEKEVGFDLGGRGSITEDAYFALICSSKGYRFNWVDGQIKEQSPFSIGAIIHQRRRWFCGLWLLSFDPVISFKTRLPLMLNTLLWSVAWIGPIVTVVNVLSGGGYFPSSLMFLAAVIQGGYASVYVVGAYRNIITADISITRKFLMYISSYVFLPVASMIEGVAIMYAIVSPVKTFDVVEK